MRTHELPDGLVIEGHVLDALASLPAESVQMCVTSPPYFGLRKYSGEQTTQWADGQWAYGMEDSPARWAEHTLEWLRAVRRVLRKDGTVWLNVGSSYGGGTVGRNDVDRMYPGSMNRGLEHISSGKAAPGYKPLDLIDPFALLYPGLLADGWYVRSVVIWAKPNPMPESVAGWFWSKCKVKTGSYEDALGNTGQKRDALKDSNRSVAGLATLDAGRPQIWADCPGCPKCTPNDGLVLRRGSWRPTSSFEYVIMLAKSASYYSDGEGVREPAITGERFHGGYITPTTDRNGRDDADNTANGRNLRDVWELPTQPYSGAHFATYPEELVKRCILASTPDAGVCAVCGSPMARVVSHSTRFESGSGKAGNVPEGKHAGSIQALSGDYDIRMGPVVESTTLGWRPTCSHSEATPATILDPFGGSGTSAVVARSLGRRFVCIELSGDYVQMALRRLMLTQPAMAGLV